MGSSEKDKALKRIMDENDAEVYEANAEVEKMVDLNFEEFRAETIKHLKYLNESIGGTTGALYHSAAQYKADRNMILDLLGARFKDIDGAIKIMVERLENIEFCLWMTIITQLRERGLYTQEKGRWFAKELHVDFDRTLEVLKDREAA